MINWEVCITNSKTYLNVLNLHILGKTEDNHKKLSKDSQYQG